MTPALVSFLHSELPRLDAIEEIKERLSQTMLTPKKLRSLLILAYDMPKKEASIHAAKLFLELSKRGLAKEDMLEED